MANIILHKRSSTPGTVPTSGALSQGELGINIGDGKLYTKNSGNNIINLGVTSISGTSITPSSGNFSNYLAVNGVPVSVSGHSHTSVPQAQSLVTSVFNKTGSSIPKFSVVYINGGQGDQPTIQLAIASNEAGSSKTYGVTAEAISNMSSGNVVVAGALTGLNTDQFNPNAPTGDVNGTSLWLSPTVSGSVTTTKPYASNHAVFVGTIVRTHQNAGVVEVRVQNGYELEELHNVAVSGVSGGQFLYYNSSSGLWQPNTNIYSSGNSIGIGTSFPNGTFDVYGNIFVGTNVNGKLIIGDDSYGGELGILTNVDEALAIKYNDGSFRYGESLPGASDGIVISSGKNVGIGTASPTSKLHVNGDVLFEGGSLTFDGSTLNVAGLPNNNPVAWGDPGIITAGMINGPTTITLHSYTNNANFEDGYWGGGVISLATADSAGSTPTLTITPFGFVFGDSTVQSTAWTGSITSSQVTDFNSSVSGLLPTGIVRTTGNQTISGVKTFANGLKVVGNSAGIPLELGVSEDAIVLFGKTSNGLGIGSSSFNFSDGSTNVIDSRELLIGPNTNDPTVTISRGLLFAGNSGVGVINYYDNGNGISANRLIFDVSPATTLASANTTLRTTTADGNNIVLNLPNTSGTLALLTNINTSQITGVLSVSKGGTNTSTYSNGQLLIGSGTSLVANTLTSTSGIGITNGSGTITIGVTGIPSNTITNFNSSVSGLINGIYAPLNSPALIGVPTVPTASSGTNTTQIASTAFVRTEISNLVAAAPSALDTLNELATALGNDANFSTTVTNNLAGKANLSGAIFTGSVSSPSGNFTSLKVNSVDVSASGHTHLSSNITNFNSSVSGLLPTGTANYITKFGTGGSGLSNSIIYESGNNIGIGVTTPDAKLVVSGSLYTTDKLGVGGACRSTLSADLGGAVGLAWSEGTFIGMQFQNTDAYRMGIVGVAGSRQTRILAKAADNAGIITFYPGAGTSEAGRFHSDGRFGIGTTSPASQLQVAGLLQGNSVGTTGIIVSNSHASQSANGQDHTSLYVNPTFLTSSSNLNNTYGLLISPSSSGQYTTTNSYGLYVNASTLVTGTILGNYAAVFMGGNVGVGTASPSSRLEVAASATTSIDIAHFSNSNGVEKAKFSLSSNGDGTLSLIDGNNVTNAFLSSSSTSNSYVNGKFGIGTSTPSGHLDVAGDVYIRGTGNNLGTIYFKSQAAGDKALYIGATNGGDIVINGNGPNAQFSSQGGYVNLLGSSTQMHIGHGYDAGNTSQIIRFVPAAREMMRMTTSGTLGIGLPTSASSYAGNSIQLFNQQPYANTRVHIAGSGADSGSAALIVTNSGISPLLYVRNDGNIGIGTVTPTSKLHVAGDVLATGSFIAGSGSASNPSFEFVNDTDTGLFSPASNTIALATSGVERLRINNIGNVGINTTNFNFFDIVNSNRTAAVSVSGDVLIQNALYFYNPSEVDNRRRGLISSDGDGILNTLGVGEKGDMLGNAVIMNTNGLVVNNGGGLGGSACQLLGDYGAIIENTLIVNSNINGNAIVGIGTSTPSFTLDINGDIGDSTNGAINVQGLIISNGGGTTGLTVAPTENIIITADQIDMTGPVNINGNLTFDTFTERVVANGNSGTSTTLSLASGTVHTCTLTGNCTFTMPTSTAGKSFTMFLNSGSGNYTASFSGVRWADSATPTATILANKVDIYSFTSDGSYWYGSFSQNYG